MVCRLSLGRDGIEATDEELSAAVERCDELRQRLVDLVDEDTAAFAAIMAAVRLPKDDERQRAVRKAALAEATLGAATPPLETLSAAAETLALAAALAGRVNPMTTSDLGVAVGLGLAAAEGGLLNVATNLNGVAPSEAVERLRRESRTGIEAARASAEAASATIAASLGLV